MKRIYIMMTALLMMAGVTTATAQEAQTIPGKLDLSKGVYVGNGSCNEAGDATDALKHGDTATFTIKNATAQAYKITFEAVTNRGNARVIFEFSDGENIICAPEVAISNTGWSWDNVKSYTGYTTELPVSDNLTLTMKFQSSGGNWVGNFRNIEFAVKADGEGNEDPKEEIVNQIPTDDAHPFLLTDAKIDGTGKVTEDGSFDSFRNNATASVLVDCTVAGNYKVAFTAASKNGCTLVFRFMNEANEVELEKEVAVEGQGDWSTFDVESNLGQLSVGKKTLVISFLSSGNNWTANVKNLQFTIAPKSTGIRSITGNETPVGQVYTLDGRNVAGQSLQKGIYIVGGKKVIR